MAAADPAFEFLQRFQSMMESFDECLSQLCKDNISESARDLRKNLMESYHDLQKALQSRYETLKIKEKKLEFLFNRVLPAVSVRSEIKIFCDKADGRGLRNYIRDHMNEGEALQKELFVALLKEPDAVKLVINALEPPFFQHKKASILLFECLYLIFGNDDSCVFPSDIKDSAREIAKAWKKEMNMENSNRASRVNIMAFLKFLASFKIAADYERDELWRLLLAVLTNEQTLELCRSLGLSPNVSEFIDMLSKDGKRLEALRYADAFGMLDKVDHVDLMTSYLRDVEKAGKEVVTNAQGTAASQVPGYMAMLQRDAAMKLKAALRGVINTCRKYGLESHFFEDKLKRLGKGGEPEEQPEPGTRGKNNESKTSKVTGLNPAISKLEREEEDTLKNSNNARINRKKAARKNAEQEEDGKKAAEKKAQERKEKEDGNNAAKKKAENIEEEEKKAAEKKAQEIEDREDRKKDGEKKAREIEEKEDGNKAVEKRAQEKEEKEGEKKDAEKTAQEKEDGNKVAGKKVQEKDGKKDAGKNAQEEAGKKDAEKKAREKEDGRKAAEKKAEFKEEREDGKKAAENEAQHKRRQSFDPGYGLSKRENYASKRVKVASLNETTRVVGGMDNSKPSPYNIDGVQNNYRFIGHDHHPSASGAANTGLAAGAFASVPSIGAQINNERRRHEGYPLAFGTSNLTPIGSSLYSASVPAGRFAVPLSNVAEVNYDGRVQESYKLNFGEIHNNPVRASSYVTGVSTNSFATQSHYERRAQELYTSKLGGGNTVGIESSVYGSNPYAIPSSVNQGNRESSLGQSSGFAGRNAVPAESSGYGSGVSTVPPSSVSQGPFERRGSVMGKYTFNRE